MTALYVVTLVWMAFARDKDVALFATMAINGIGTVSQPWEAGRKKGGKRTTGVLKVEMLEKFCMSATIWACYCWQQHYIAPVVSFGGFALFQLGLIIQWHVIRFSTGSSK